MVNNVMFPQWKLIFQKTNLRNLILLMFGLLIVILFVLFTNDSCNFERILILDDISSYDQSLDPEFCEIVVEKIDVFNNKCEPTIEILDCG